MTFQLLSLLSLLLFISKHQKVAIVAVAISLIALTSPRCKLVFFQLLHFGCWRLVIHLQDPDEVCDGEHPHELLVF